MSQEKVDRYKKEKANRKEMMKKERRASILRRSVAGVIAVAIIGWAGYSVYNTYENNKSTEQIQLDYSAISDYESGLTATE